MKCSNGDAGFLELTGPATVYQADELQRALATALQDTQRLTVDVSGVTDSDVALLQILCAAHKSASGSDSRQSLEISGIEILAETINLAYPDVVCPLKESDGCLFRGEIPVHGKKNTDS